MMKGFSISSQGSSPAAAWARKLALPVLVGVLGAVLVWMNQELVASGISSSVAAVKSLVGGSDDAAPAPAPAAAPAPAPAVAATDSAAKAPADSNVTQAGAAQAGVGRAGVPGAAAKAAATKAADAASNRVNAQVVEEDTPPAAKAPAVTPAAKPAAPATMPAAAVPAAGRATSPALEAAAMIHREVFSYEADGRRDPFVSLMRTTDLRPALQDLRLTGILFDHTGQRPVAIMRESATNEQYRVTTGMTLGRMRVAEIHPKKVIFIIEEFGFSRRDSLVLVDPTTKRIP